MIKVDAAPNTGAIASNKSIAIERRVVFLLTSIRLTVLSPSQKSCEMTATATRIPTDSDT